MRLLALLALVAGREPEATQEEEARRAEQLRVAQERLREAMQQARPEPPPPRATPNVGHKVDKYFGTRLPPVCERLGCYLTDDGKRFYCVNPGCQKHKKRATKHTKVTRARAPKEVFFRCPKCLSRSVELLLLTNEHACTDCGHRWPREKLPPQE